MRIKLKQRGVTLLEVLAVVIIAILLSIGAFSLYTSSQDKKMEQDTISAIASLRLLIQDSYAGGDYVGLDNEALIQRVSIPSSFVVNGNQIIHPLGGEVIVEGNEYGFGFSLVGLSENHCVSLGSRQSIASAISLNNEVSSGTSSVVDHCSNGGSIGFIFSNRVSDFLTASSSNNNGTIE